MLLVSFIAVIMSVVMFTVSLRFDMRQLLGSYTYTLLQVVYHQTTEETN